MLQQQKQRGARNKMNIRMGVVTAEIPHIIHGVSANTMFYLINFNKLFKDKAFEDQMTTMSTPFDTDDFARIINAWNVFGWGQKDIETAIKNAEELKCSKRLIEFLDNFLVLRSFYQDGEDDEFDALLTEINSIPIENEFSIDTSKLGI